MVLKNSRDTTFSLPRWLTASGVVLKRTVLIGLTLTVAHLETWSIPSTHV